MEKPLSIACFAALVALTCALALPTAAADVPQSLQLSRSSHEHTPRLAVAGGLRPLFVGLELDLHEALGVDSSAVHYLVTLRLSPQDEKLKELHRLYEALRPLVLLGEGLDVGFTSRGLEAGLTLKL